MAGDGQPIAELDDGDDEGFDFDQEFVKLNTNVEALNQNLSRLGGTVPDVKALLQNYLAPVLTRMVNLLGAARQISEQTEMLAQQALAMSERTLAGETLSFLVPGMFVFEKYLVAWMPDENAPLRRQFSYLLQACEGVREIFGEQYEQVEQALDRLVGEAGADATTGPGAEGTGPVPPATPAQPDPVNPVG